MGLSNLSLDSLELLFFLSLGSLYMVGLLDFLCGFLAHTASFSTSTATVLPFKVVKSRCKECLVFIHLSLTIELLQYLADQLDCLWVVQISVDSHTRQNKQLTQVLSAFVLILSRQQVEAIDLLLELLFLLLPLNVLNTQFESF